MQNALKQESGVDWRKLQFLLIVLLIIGIFFRFVNIDRKVYWHDEVLTSLRIAGYTRVEAFQDVSKNNIINSQDLQKYQHTNPEKGLRDTMKSLAAEEPEKSPLYFVMARFWTQWFGSSPAEIRSLSAILSLLAFPCMYWLCQELFESLLTGWMAIALIAVSPFHVLYAQEARMYSLWTVAILLSSASLLQAMRLKTKVSWGIYAATVALGIYSHTFFVSVVIGQGIYVYITDRCRLSRRVILYLLASVTGLLTFVPWITSLKQIDPVSGWTLKKIHLGALGEIWANNISRLFFDLDFHHDDPLIYSLTPVLMVLSLIGYSIYFICRHSSKKVWLFVLILMGATVLYPILPDLVLGGRRSSVGRHLIPCFLGIQLAVAYLLSTKITRIYVKRRSQKLWQIVMLLVFSAGVLSCASSSPAETWWNKYFNYYTPQAASIINKTAKPLVITDCKSIGGILSLNYLLEPKVGLEFLVKPDTSQIPDGFSDVFLIYPSEELLSEIKKEYKYVEHTAVGELWHMKK